MARKNLDSQSSFFLPAKHDMDMRWERREFTRPERPAVQGWRDCEQLIEDNSQSPPNYFYLHSPLVVVIIFRGNIGTINNGIQTLSQMNDSLLLPARGERWMVDLHTGYRAAWGPKHPDLWRVKTAPFILRPTRSSSREYTGHRTTVKDYEYKMGQLTQYRYIWFMYCSSGISSEIAPPSISNHFLYRVASLLYSPSLLLCWTHGKL